MYIYDQINTTSVPFIITLPDANILYYFTANQISLMCNNTHKNKRSQMLSSSLAFADSSPRGSPSVRPVVFLFDYLPHAPSLDPVSFSFPIVNVSIPNINVRMLPNFTAQPNMFDFLTSYLPTMLHMDSPSSPPS